MTLNHQIAFDFSFSSAIPFVTPSPSAPPPTIPSNTKPAPQEIIVNSLRLGDQGDISNSCSADLVDKGRIRKPFRYNGELYISTSTISGFYPNRIRQAQAYRLTLSTLFNGPVTDFQTKVRPDHGESARSDPNGFYHGIAVSHQSRQYVLTGPPLTFIPNIPKT